MAAPDTSPDLSVVSEEKEKSPSGTPSERANSPQPPPAEPAPPTKADRRGAPWWLVVAVGVVGLILFLNQYQRAEGLDARVASLSEELVAADQRLQTAQEHIAAHQAHLDRVRGGVANLSEQVAGLEALANQDPLAPAPAASTDAAAAASPAEAAESAGRDGDTAAPVEESDAAVAPAETAPSESGEVAGNDAGAPAQAGSGSLTDAEGYYWRAEGTPVTDQERRGIIESTLSTSFVD